MTYLFFGYLVIWTVLFFYLVFLARSQKRVNDKLKALSETLQQRD
ncbi:MAG: CcmD family protein [Acidobacteria bacterium]|nr:CcmD family protein [Acidobacteriota bacterium]